MNPSSLSPYTREHYVREAMRFLPASSAYGAIVDTVASVLAIKDHENAIRLLQIESRNALAQKDREYEILKTDHELLKKRTKEALAMKDVELEQALKDKETAIARLFKERLAKSTETLLHDEDEGRENKVGDHDGGDLATRAITAPNASL